MAQTILLGDVKYAPASPYVNGDLDRQQIEALQAVDQYAQDCWVCWGNQLTNKSGQPKMPIDPATMRVALRGEVALSGSFEAAVAKLDGDWVAGVGIMLERVTPGMVAVDLDHVRNAETGELSKTGAKLLRLLKGRYVEVSPSGTGLRAILYAGDLLPQWLRIVVNKPGAKVKFDLDEIGPDGKNVGVELFCPGGHAFVRMSGRLVEGHKAQVGVGEWALAVLDWVREMRPDTTSSASRIPAIEPRSQTTAHAGVASFVGDPWARLTEYRGYQEEDHGKLVDRIRKSIADTCRLYPDSVTSKQVEILKKRQDRQSEDEHGLRCEVIRRGADCPEVVNDVLRKLAGGRLRDKLENRQDLGDSDPTNAAKSVVEEIERGGHSQWGKAKLKIWANLPGTEQHRGGAGGDTTPPPTEDPNGFIRDQRGRMLPAATNAAAAIKTHPDLHTMFAFNEWSLEVEVSGSLRAVNPDASEEIRKRTLGNEELAVVRDWLVRQYGLNLGSGDVMEGILLASFKRRYDPLKQAFDNLPAWDGVERIPNWLVTYLKADNTGKEDFVSEAGRCFFVGAVARAFAGPGGVTVQETLVLQSAKGGGKSSAMEILAEGLLPGSFTDQVSKLDDRKYIIEQTQGKFIVELAELCGVRSVADINALKAELTAKVLKARLAYERKPVEIPKRFVYVGTTNDLTYIHEDASSRRFYPVTLNACEENQIRFEDLKNDAPQLWAEAKYRYDQGEKWFIPATNKKAFSQWVEVRNQVTEEKPFHGDLKNLAIRLYQSGMGGDYIKGMGAFGLTMRDIAVVGLGIEEQVWRTDSVLQSRITTAAEQSKMFTTEGGSKGGRKKWRLVMEEVSKLIHNERNGE